MLEINNLLIQYGEKAPAIDGISLSMKEGENHQYFTFYEKDLLNQSRKGWRELRGTEISMIFQDCSSSLNPIRKIGVQFVEYIRTHREMSKTQARVFVLQGGRVVDQGETKKVLTNPTSSYTKELLAAIPDMEGVRYV